MTSIPLPVAELKSALTGLAKLNSRQPAGSIAQMIHIERKKDGWICLTSTDFDRFATVRLEQLSPGEPVSLLVHPEDLQRVVKACSRDETLELIPGNGGRVTVRFPLARQSGQSKVRSAPVQEYPAIPKIRGTPIPFPEHLRTSFHEAMACSSNDDTRYVLQEAFIDTHRHDGHYIVGTDGKHLYSSNSFQLPIEKPLLIPKHKFLGWREFNVDGEWQLKVGESQSEKPPLVQLSSRRWRYITRQIDGQYPNWKQVVPATDTIRTTLVLDPKSFGEAIRNIELLPSYNDKDHTIGLEWNGRQLRLLAQEAPTSVPVRCDLQLLSGKGPALTIHLNRLLLIKALQYGLNTVRLIDGISPLRFEREGKQMTVMPVRVKGGTEPPPFTAREPRPTDVAVEHTIHESPQREPIPTRNIPPIPALTTSFSRRRTETWTPIPHTTLVNTVQTALKAAQLRIGSQAHSLTHDGSRYFGLMEIMGRQGNDDYCWVLGLRNSHDKTFPAGIVAGASVFVCDNLSFSGEVKFARKHTPNIVRDLPFLTTRAIGQLVSKWKHQDIRIAAYKEAELEDQVVHDLVIRATDVGVCRNRLIPSVIEQWREPPHQAFQPRNAWSLFNAFTAALKKSNLAELPKRTEALHGLLDSHVGLTLN